MSFNSSMEYATASLSRLPSFQHNNTLVYRPAGAPRNGLQATQSVYGRPGAPSLSVDTSYRPTSQAPRYAGAGAFLTPPPSQYASPSGNPAPQYQYTGAERCSTFDLTPPPTDSPQDNGSFNQYLQHPPTEDMMFVYDCYPEDDTAGASGPDPHWQQSSPAGAAANEMVRTASIGSVASQQQQHPGSYLPAPRQETNSYMPVSYPQYGTGSNLPSPPQYGGSVAPTQDRFAQTVPGTLNSQGGMPINNKYGYFPNAVLDGRFNNLQMQHSNPSSSYGGVGGMEGSLGSHHSYQTASGSGYSMPSSPPYSAPGHGLPLPCQSVAAGTGYSGSQYVASAHTGNPLYPLGFHSPSPAPAQAPGHSIAVGYGVGHQMVQSVRQQHVPSMQLPAALHHLDDNQKLVYCRDHMNMPFKEIQRQLFPKVPDSTLRGRYRNATKDREARVRKPEWTDKDVSYFCDPTTSPVLTHDGQDRLLRQAVIQKLGDSVVGSIHTEEDLSRACVAGTWKEVCEYIVSHDGSYEFCPATAKKRYVQLYCSRSGAAATARSTF